MFLLKAPAKITNSIFTNLEESIIIITQFGIGTIELTNNHVCFTVRDVVTSNYWEGFKLRKKRVEISILSEGVGGTPHPSTEQGKIKTIFSKVANYHFFFLL